MLGVLGLSGLLIIGAAYAQVAEIRAALAGKRFSYYSADADWADIIWLCSDGSFVLRQRAIVGSTGNPGGRTGDLAGRWQPHGDGQSAYLVLDYTDGDREVIELSGMDDQGNLLVSGRTWYDTGSAGC